MHVDETGRPFCTGECPLSRTMADGRPRRAELYLRHKQGHSVPVKVRVCPVPGKDGEIVGAVEVFNDNSRQRALRERARDLVKLAFLDSITQVASRCFLGHQLIQQLDQHSKCSTPFGIMLADVDEFKKVNDTYGHVNGNAAWVTMVKTLSGCLRASDVLGRWGGDEFLVILPDITKDILVETSERCRVLVANSTVPVEGSQIQLTISVGAAMDTLGDTPESLVNSPPCQYS
jgi:diguanylate cyclase (GGDEF)-like protein